MNDLNQMRARAKPRNRLPRDVDGLLRFYLRSEMPEPWPDWKVPVTPAVGLERGDRKTSTERDGGWLRFSRSQLALAASVVFLLIGAWSVSGMRSDSLPLLGGTGTGNKTANKPTEPNKPNGQRFSPASSNGPSHFGPTRTGLSSGRR